MKFLCSDLCGQHLVLFLWLTVIYCLGDFLKPKLLFKSWAYYMVLIQIWALARNPSEPSSIILSGCTYTLCQIVQDFFLSYCSLASFAVKRITLHMNHAVQSAKRPGKSSFLIALTERDTHYSVNRIFVVPWDPR